MQLEWSRYSSVHLKCLQNMPPKSRQKGSGRKPLSVSNGEHKQNGTLDSYFPPSPPGNNNEADVNLTTGHLCEQPISGT